MENKTPPKPPTHKDIEAWYEHTAKFIKEKFDDKGVVDPCIYGLSKEGEFIIFPILKMSNDADKDMISKIFREFARSKQLVGSVFVSEGWVTVRKVIAGAPCDYDTYGRPSEQPDKKEIVMLIFETYLGARQNFYEIKRDSFKPYLVEIMKETSGFKSAGGRFHNFLSKPYGSN